MQVESASSIIADLAASLRETADKKIALIEVKNEYLQAQLKTASLEGRMLRMDLDKAYAQIELLTTQLDKINEDRKNAKPGKGEPNVKS